MSNHTFSRKASAQPSAASRPHHSKNRPKSAPDPTAESSPCDKRILLVDDDATVRDSLTNVLVSEGYAVTSAANGQEAIEFASHGPADLVVLDLKMPVVNGWDTFEQLSREHPLIPIIIVTARPNQLFTALNAGVGALLEKPMDIPTLLQTIEKLLAETDEQRLRRLAGRKVEFYYRPAHDNPG